MLVELSQLEVPGSGEASPVVPLDLQTMVEEFRGVFNMPMGLPPARDRDHAINILEGSNPVSVRPYRYPQIQKKKNC